MSFPRYPEYKDSGVEWLGAVPDHWKLTPVKNIARIVNGYPFDSKLFSASEGYPLIRIRDLNQIEANAFYTGEFVEAAAITPDDVLIGMDGDFNVGRWRGASKALLNQRMCCIRGCSEGITRLLEYALPIPLREINNLTYATTVKHLSSSQVEKTIVALPHDDKELYLLLAFLDRETAKIDDLMAEQEKLIALLKEKRQAVIAHAVTKGLDPTVPVKDSGVEWLGEVPAHWEVSQLKHVARDGTSITYGIVQAGPHVEGGIPYIKTSDMSGESLPLEGYSRTSSEIDQSYSRSKVFFGDLVIAIRASVGKCLPLPEELDGANLTQGTAKISPGECVERDYLLNLINSTGLQVYFDSMAKGATFKEITLDMLRRTPVLIPPLAEQRDIARYLATELKSFQNLLQETEKAISLLKERRTSLISAAVTGQIDVRGLAKEEQEQAA